MTETSSSSPERLVLLVEPFLFTSTITKFDNVGGYQLLVRGESLLAPNGPEDAVLRERLEEASQMTVAADSASTFLMPLGPSCSAAVRVTRIDDWRGRPGGCASALVFRHEGLGEFTAADVAEFLFTSAAASGAFMSHATALKIVADDKKSKACPILLRGRKLEISLKGDGGRGTALRKSLVVAERLWSQSGASLALPAEQGSLQCLRAAMAVLPPKRRFDVSLGWNLASENKIKLSSPAVYLGGGEPAGGKTLTGFPDENAKLSDEAAKLIEIFHDDTAAVVEYGSRVLRRGGGGDSKLGRFWTEIADAFVIEQVLANETYLDSNIGPERVAQALDILQRGSPRDFEEWVGGNGAKIFAAPERFKRVYAALKAEANLAPTAKRMEELLPATLIEVLNKEAPGGWVNVYRGEGEIVQKIIFPGFAAWLKTGPDIISLTQLEFLKQVPDPVPWVKEIVTSGWLKQALEYTYFQKVLASILTPDAPLPARRHIWVNAIEDGDTGTTHWAVDEPGLVVMLKVEDLDKLQEDQVARLAPSLRQAIGKKYEMPAAVMWDFLQIKAPAVEVMAIRKLAREYLGRQVLTGPLWTDYQLGFYLQSMALDTPREPMATHWRGSVNLVTGVIRRHFPIFGSMDAFTRFLFGVGDQLDHLDVNRDALSGEFQQFLREKQQTEQARQPRPPEPSRQDGSTKPLPWKKIGIIGAAVAVTVVLAVVIYMWHADWLAHFTSEAINEMR